MKPFVVISLMVVVTTGIEMADEEHLDKYFMATISSKLNLALSSTAQIHEASKTWTYSLMVDSNGISHYVYIRKATGLMFQFVKALRQQFDASTRWKGGLIESTSLVNYITNLLTNLQSRITDQRYFQFGFPAGHIYRMYEDILEFIDLAQQLEDHLLREALLRDLNIAFNHLQRLVEQTERYAPVVKTGQDVITLFSEKHGRMFFNQRGCAKSDGRIIRSSLESQEIILGASANTTASSWNNVVYYGQPVTLKNPKCSCFLTNADFDCYGTMAWDKADANSESEFFRFLSPDLSVSLARPLRIGDRVVLQSQRDNTFVCPVDASGTTRLLPSAKSCDFQVRFRTAQIPQI